LAGRKKIPETDEDLKVYMRSVDFYIFKEQKTKTPVLIDPESGLFISGIYLLSRCNLSDPDIQSCYWRENAIYLVEDCEKIVYKKTNGNNIFLPKLNLKLLNSILYFIIEVHKKKVYPYCTTKLIEFLCLRIPELIKESEIHDIITSAYLLSLIEEDTAFREFIDINLIKDSISKSADRIENIWNFLSEAAWNGFLYENKYIFEKTYLNILQYKPECVHLLYDNRTENKDISIKELIWTGFGLLTY